MQVLEDMPKVKGIWHIAAYEEELAPGQEPTTDPVWEETKENLVVTSGKHLLLERLFGVAGAGAAVQSIGVGDNNGAAAVGQTGLLGTTNVLILTTDSTPTRSGLTVTMVRTFSTSQANFNWQEVGAFNGNVNNTSIMLNRIVIGPFNKTSAVSIVVTLTFTQA